MSTTQGWYTPDAGPAEDERPLGELFSDMSRSLQTLVRKEVELAKVELKDQASKAGKASASLVAGAAVAYLALVLLAFAAAWGLAEAIPTGVAFLAVGLLFGVIGALLLVVGKNRLATVRPVPRQTVATLREDVDVAKASVARGIRS